MVVSLNILQPKFVDYWYFLHSIMYVYDNIYLFHYGENVLNGHKNNIFFNLPEQTLNFTC